MLSSLNGSAIARYVDFVSYGTWDPVMTVTDGFPGGARPKSPSYYTRIGRIVMCRLVFFTNAMAANHNALSVTIPIASNFTYFDQCTGTCISIMSSTLAPLFGAVTADPTIDQAFVNIPGPSSFTSSTCICNFTYTII